MSRGQVIGVLFGVLFYICGITKAVLTPIENVFFGLSNPVQVAVFVALIALWLWFTGRRLAHRRELYRQAQRIIVG